MSADFLTGKKDKFFLNHTYPKTKGKKDNIVGRKLSFGGGSGEQERSLLETNMKISDNIFLHPSNGKKEKPVLFTDTHEISSGPCLGSSVQVDPSIKNPRKRQAINLQDSFGSTDQTPSDDNDSEVYFFDLTGSNPATVSPALSTLCGFKRQRKDFNSSIDCDSQSSVSENNSQGKSGIKKKSKKRSISNEIVMYNGQEQSTGEVIIHNTKTKPRIKSEEKDYSDVIKCILDCTIEISDSESDTSGCGSSIPSTSSKKKIKRSSLQKNVNFADQSAKLPKKEELSRIEEGTIPDDVCRSVINGKSVTNDKHEANEVMESESKLLASSNFVNAMGSLTKYIDRKGLDCFMEGNNMEQICSTPLKTKKKDKQNKTLPIQNDVSLMCQNEEIRRTLTKSNAKRTSLETKDGTEAENSVDRREVQRKIQNLNIIVPFEIPSLHLISTKPSKFSKEQSEMVSSLKIPIKQGRFTKVEDDIILSNWKRFQKEHDLGGIPPSAFCKLPTRVSLTNRLNFMRYIAHGLNDRPLHRVQERFRLLFNKPCEASTTLRKFTEEEDEYILKTVRKYSAQHPHVFKNLGDLLGRGNKVIAKHYQLLTGPSEKRQKIKWDIDMCSKLIRKLLKIMKFNNVEKLKEVEVPHKIFQKLSKKMNISTQRIKKVYLERIHPRLFADEHLTSDQLKKIIIERLYKTGVQDLTLVDWKDLAKYCHGVNAVALSAKFTRLVRVHIAKEHLKSFPENVEFLYKYMQYNDFIQSKIKTWTYEDGRIQVLGSSKDYEDSESNDSGNNSDKK